MKSTPCPPPANARYVMRVSDLPQDRRPATYEIRNNDEMPRIVTLSKRNRQVLDLLRTCPVFAASRLRIGDTVHTLRHDMGLDIRTLSHPGDPKTGSGNYGSYHLESQVTLLSDEKGAAA